MTPHFLIWSLGPKTGSVFEELVKRKKYLVLLTPHFLIWSLGPKTGSVFEELVKRKKYLVLLECPTLVQ